MRRQSWWHVVCANAASQGRERHVLTVLALHATRNGFVGLPLPLIAEFTGLSIKIVRSCLSRLVLLRDLRLSRKGGGGRTHAVYQIIVPAIRDVDTKRWRVTLVEAPEPTSFPPLRLMEQEEL